MALMADFAARARRDDNVLCFAGAGAYDHHIPSAVWDLVSRGEIMTYTPYQAEASQGTLQTIYEYQSMIAKLTGMDVANASVYDGGSGLAEAALMAVRSAPASTPAHSLLAGGLNFAIARPAKRLCSIRVLPFAIYSLEADGSLCPATLEAAMDEDCAALVIGQPNFFGVLEDVHALTDRAQAAGLLVIAVVNPIALAVLTPPGAWGSAGPILWWATASPWAFPWLPAVPTLAFVRPAEAGAADARAHRGSYRGS